MDEKNKQAKPIKSVSKPDETPESHTGTTTAKTSKWKRLLAKKWAFPAMYMAAAAIILSIMWAYQGSDKNTMTDANLGLSLNADLVENPDADVLPVTIPEESMRWPVANFSETEVLRPFYDKDASSEAKQAATIQYGDTFYTSLGISLAKPGNEPFDVLAALSGTVTRVEQHPLVGHLVEITHSKGLKTVYQSLSDIQVEEGDEVTQGDVIAKAGRNELEKDLGIHVHFEVHENGQPVNPELYIQEDQHEDHEENE